MLLVSSLIEVCFSMDLVFFVPDSVDIFRMWMVSCIRSSVAFDTTYLVPGPLI